MVGLFRRGGCDCSKWGGVPAPEDKPGAPAEAVEVTPVGPNSSPMFGGTINSNLANTVEKGIPDTWSIAKGAEKNVKWSRSEEHTSELQSHLNLVCRLLLEKK